MIRIILDADNKDILLIKELADRLKIKYKIQSTIKKSGDSNPQSYYQIIDKGVDVSNFGDPSIWQKKVREDRNINLS